MASAMGFEPTISSVTGWRGLHSSTRPQVSSNYSALNRNWTRKSVVILRILKRSPVRLQQIWGACPLYVTGARVSRNRFGMALICSLASHHSTGESDFLPRDLQYV